MDLITILIFLSSGLFLGWSLGANDASNVFGSAVGTRMVRFSTAAVLCSIFVILGAVIGGAGAAGGLGALGAVNALGGSFTVALSAAATVLWMTKLGLPVSTTQAVVGGIVGWNWFSGSITNLQSLSKIVGTWVFCPILGAIFAAILYKLLVMFVKATKPHLLQLDYNVRGGLIFAGIFGSYALGANNIGNVMGVFVSSNPFEDVSLARGLSITGVEQLFLLGAIAIAVGVITYSKRVMMTVGGSVMTLSPLGALVVVVAHSLVLFIFSSSELSNAFVSIGLPPIPLIPVSSSQAVIGAVIGIGLLQGLKGIRQIKWRVLAGIASGWVTTPVMSAIMGFTLLFVVQNVFGQQVFQPVSFRLSPPALERLSEGGIAIAALKDLENESVSSAVQFRSLVRERVQLDRDGERLVLSAAELHPMRIEAEAIATLDLDGFSAEQLEAIAALEGESFSHKWQLSQALARRSQSWAPKAYNHENNELNQQLGSQLDTLFAAFQVPAASLPE